jgi:Lar family restriction alleviation protein
VSEEIEWLRCPFCGSNLTVSARYKNEGEGDWRWFVKCENCEAYGPSLSETEELAIQSWNCRVARRTP